MTNIKRRDLRPAPKALEEYWYEGKQINSTDKGCILHSTGYKTMHAVSSAKPILQYNDDLDLHPSKSHYTEHEKMQKSKKLSYSSL